MLAEIDLQQGRLRAAKEQFEHAFALGCQLGDPCWEGISGRGLGPLAMAQGDAERAERILEDSLDRCGRLPDAYLWGRADVLAALCQLGVASHSPKAQRWIAALIDIAARAGMRELLVRAHRHQEHLGDSDGAVSVRALAHDIDTPARAALTFGNSAATAALESRRLRRTVLPAV